MGMRMRMRIGMALRTRMRRCKIPDSDVMEKSKGKEGGDVHIIPRGG